MMASGGTYKTAVNDRGSFKTMNNTVLQKYFSGIEGLRAHEFFNKTGIVDDVRSGAVFPAIRKEELHFYYSGARLCVYKNGRLSTEGKMLTNNRYLGIRDGDRSRDIPIPDDWFSPTKYRELKNNCHQRRPGESELEIVSQLFPEFSFCASALPAERARLLDIEIRFPGIATSTKRQDMIDCLFITPRGILVFVEVKRSSNDEARSSGQGQPAVVSQLRGYREQLASDEKMIEHIKQVYAGVTSTLRIIFGNGSQPLTINDVFRSVPLLIVGKASTLTKASKEIWQRDLLTSPFVLNSEIIGIDGRGARMTEALLNLFRAIDQQQ
jgi:hypothetical protein